MLLRACGGVPMRELKLAKTAPARLPLSAQVRLSAGRLLNAVKPSNTELRHKLAGLLSVRGHRWLEMGDDSTTAAAVECFSEAGKLDPLNPHRFTHKAIALVRSRSFEPASFTLKRWNAPAGATVVLPPPTSATTPPSSTVMVRANSYRVLFSASTRTLDVAVAASTVVITQLRSSALAPSCSVVVVTPPEVDAATA